GGVGFFFLIIEPLSKKVLKPREEDIFKIEVRDNSPKRLTIKTLLYSAVFAIPGMLIMSPLLIYLPLTVSGMMEMILFGMAFGILILLWRLGRKNDMSLFKIHAGIFKGGKEHVLRQVVLGLVLTVILYNIIYLSFGLNYIGWFPSIFSFPWIPIYLAIGLFIIAEFYLLFNTILQPKFKEGLAGVVKVGIIGGSCLCIYTCGTILLFCILLESFFFTIFFHIAIPLTYLLAFVSALLYKKTGNIITGAIVSTVILVMLLCTLAPYANYLMFLH
ncbi:MAG: hypothetical protein ACFFCS_05890, partial [Candidatus Hodarchaeota archaeon]